MKRFLKVCTCLLSLLFAGTRQVFSQEVVGFHISAGIEANLYSIDTGGIGARIIGSYRFGERIEFGTSALATTDFDKLTTIEFSAKIRYYLFRSEEELIKHFRRSMLFHIFLQADLGGAVFIEETKSLYPMVLAGITGGVRISMGDFSQWSFEPYLRAGYPFLFGVGIVGVYRFPIRGVFW